MSAISKITPTEHKFPRHYGKSILEKYAVHEEKQEETEEEVKETVKVESSKAAPAETLRSYSRDPMHLKEATRGSAFASVQPSP